GRNVTDTLAKLSETRQVRRKRSASLSLSLLIRVSASPVHTPTRWNVALSRSKTVTVSDITHARHNDRVVGAGGRVGATLSVSGPPPTSETSHSSSSSAGLWSNTHTISASLLTITRKRTKSQRKLTEQYSMSVSRTRRRGGMSDTVTETDEFTWKVSESSTKMTKSASKSSTLMGRSRSLSTTVTGPTHSTVLPSHTPTRVIGLHAAGHSHSLSQGALTSTVSLTIASRTRSYSKKRGGGGGGGGEWMMWLSTTVSVTPSLSQSRSGRRYRNNGGAWGDGGERTHSALEWSLTISTTAMLTVTPTLTPTYPHHVNASASSTLLVITDTLSRLKPTISDASLSTTATVTDGESETLWTETLTKKSATLTCERPRTATPTFVHTPTSHRDRLLGGGEHWRLGSASDSQTTTLVSTLTESVSLSNTTPKPLYQEPSGGGNLGAAALTGDMLPMVGGVSLSGVPLALVLVNLVVGAVSLVSMLMFASGMRRRKKKKPDQATTTPPSTLQVDSRTSLQVEEQPNEVVGTSAGDDSDDVMIFSHPLDETEKHHSAALVSTGSNITVKFQHLTTYVAPFGRHDDVDDIEEDDDILSMNNVDERLRGRDDVEVDPIQLQIADIPNEPSTTSQLQEEGTPVKDLQPSSAPSTSVSVGGVLPLSDNDGADDTLPPTRSLFWDAVRFHTYAGVLFPCSDACGWSHAAASCVHSNLTMLLASLIGLYTSPVSSGSAFAVGLVAPPLVLGLIRWLVVEPLALPCLHNSCDTTSAEPNETTLAWPLRSALSAEEELGPEHKYLAAFLTQQHHAFTPTLRMLLASLIGLYTSPVSSGSAFAVGLVAPPLVLGLIRWLVVEPLALPCLHNSCDTTSAEPNETTLAWPLRSALSAEEELGPEHKYLAAFHSTEGIITNSSDDGSDDNLPGEQVAHPQEQNPQWSPTFAPGSSQRSLRTLDAIDLNLHRTSFAASGMWSSISGGDVVDNDHDFFVDAEGEGSSQRSLRTLDAIDLNLHRTSFAASGMWSSISGGDVVDNDHDFFVDAEGEEDTQSDFNDVVDLDALALPPLAPSPKSQFTTATGRRQSKGPTLSPLDLCSDRSPPPRSAAPKMEEGGGGGDAFDMDIDVMSLDNMMPLPTSLRSMLVGTDNKFAQPPPYNSLQANGWKPGTTLLHVDADDNFNVVSNAFDFGEEGESSAATANIRAGVPFYVPRGKPTTHDDEHSFHHSPRETWFADGDFSKLPTVLSGRYRRKMARGEHVGIDEDEKGDGHDDDDDVRFFDDSRRMEHQLDDSGINNARRGSAVLEQSYVDDDEAEMTADMLLMNAIHASVATTANIVERPPSVTNRKTKPLKRSQTTTITSAASVEDDPLQDNLIQTEWIPLDMSRNATAAARDYEDNPMTEPLVAANRSRGGDSPPPVSSLPRHHVDVPRRSLSHCRSSSAWTDADPLAHGSTPSTKLDFASPLSGASVVQISRQVGTTATADCTANGSNSFVGDQSSRPLSFSSERQTDRVPEDSSKVQQETYSQETPTLVSAAPHRQQVTIVLLLVSAVVIVLVLLFGIRNYNSSTVSIMCGAFVGDAVFGQPLRIAVVRRLLRSAA
ncbi:GPI-anchored surface protein, putative, partial [Bodo saltans]